MHDDLQETNPGDGDRAEAMVSLVRHWHHKFEVFPGVITPGSYDPMFLLEKLQLPDDLTGMRALDIGPSDGFFSMHLARRGAQVTAVDYRAKNTHGFGVMEQLTGLEFDYRQMNLYDVSAAEIGQFDLVLFLGVFYHLPDMMRALNLLSQLCRARLLVETQFEPDLMPGVAVARYYEAGTLADDITNFWVPNKECLFAMLRDTGFQVDRDDSWGKRMLVDASLSPLQRTKKMDLAYGLVPG
ncbi:tRNA (mo5U34)-methyltransferase [Hoeflea marina]|uniref:tRNA (Mo5U34)-methyltransferase n=1 Tax=Hoeflea marina TaxID=274592 RepID=A0A317PEV2_9HYPH|nr:methyltransferase domain-containing protein [Hoeflea marina]PWV98721.1 tRNA (mo5U34)-methyltransferase [Hoeflea marina]